MPYDRTVFTVYKWLSAGSSPQFLLYGEGFIFDTMILALFGPFNFGLVLKAGPGLNFGYSHVDEVTATALKHTFGAGYFFFTDPNSVSVTTEVNRTFYNTLYLELRAGNTECSSNEGPYVPMLSEIIVEIPGYTIIA